MKRFALLLTLAISCYTIYAQVPQGFNYQALARDGLNNPITTTFQVKIGFQSDTLSSAYIWEELHSTVKPNSTGLFSLVIGTGTRLSGVPVFSDIDWTTSPIYLKTYIYYNSSWKYMGSARLWSVPYSMVSGSLDGSPGKLKVVGDDVTSDEALFEVKRKDGQTMFAVYNHGVRIYMPLDTLSKARKGGFAIGGFSKAKGTVQEYFVVNPDSIRAYIDTNPDKGKKGGFAIGGFDKAKAGNEEYLRVTRDSTRIYLNDTGVKARKGGFAIGGFDKAKGNIQDFMTVSKDSIRMFIDDTPVKAKKGGFAIGGFDKAKAGNASFLNVATDASGVINPSQNRILWYPLKNAFLTGKVLITDSSNVGVNSFATGYESRAKGRYSQAMGYKAIANGDYSTAIGKNAVADKINSFAFGDSARATNAEGYAIGRGAVASGYRSFAFGSAGVDTLGNVTDISSALGDYSFAIGQGSKSIGKGSFSMGIADTAQGDFSLAIGYKTKAGGHLATALGFNTVARGIYSTVMGNSTSASGNTATAMGSGTSASGSSATAMGAGTSASGNWATAMGLDTKASGTLSTSLGSSTNAIGWVSIASGFESDAKGAASLAMGYMTNTKGDFATAMGFSTIAGAYCHVFGRYNDTINSGSPSWNNDDPLFMIGNGTLNSARSNALTVLKNGMTAIGNRWPTQMLDVNGNARFRSVGSGTFTYNLNIMSDGTLTTATSDVRMKENIYQISEALNKVIKMRGVFFNWKNDSTKIRQIGMIAQEVEHIIPEVVFTNPVDGLKGINYSQTTALLVEAIKEQQKQIESYELENDSLKSQLQTLQEEVEQIKAMLAKGGVK